MLVADVITVLQRVGKTADADFIKRVEALSVLEKTKLYLDYYINMLSLKYNFEVVDMLAPNYNKGWGTPHKNVYDIGFYFLWCNKRIMNINEFCSFGNNQLIDHGENWQQHHFAERYTVVYGGIYHWYLTSN